MSQGGALPGNTFNYKTWPTHLPEVTENLPMDEVINTRYIRSPSAQDPIYLSLLQGFVSHRWMCTTAVTFVSEDSGSSQTSLTSGHSKPPCLTD